MCVAAGYEIKEADYADWEQSDPWSVAFLDGVQSEINTMKPCLTESNLTTLVNLMVTQIVERMERCAAQFARPRLAYPCPLALTRGALCVFAALS